MPDQPQSPSSTPSPLIEWTPSFATGHAGIDAEHQQLFKLIAGLDEALSGEGDGLCAVLAELQHYTEYHFSHESRLMDTVGVSEAHRRAHRLAHNVFISTLERAMHDALNDPAAVTTELLKYLGRWLVGHIMSMDRDLVHELERLGRDQVAGSQDPRDAATRA